MKKAHQSGQALTKISQETKENRPEAACTRVLCAWHKIK